MDPEKKPNESHPSAIRTMRTDAEIYAKEKKLSTLQIAATSYASQSPISAGNENKKFPTKIILFGGIILLCVIILSIGAWWFLSSKNTESKIKEIVAPPAIITIEKQNTLTLKQVNAITLSNALSAEYDKTFSPNILTYYPIKNAFNDNNVSYINIKDFSKILDWHTPSPLLDILVPDFNLFIFSNKQSNDFAIIMKTINFEKAFSSMLEWERTLARDWQNILSNKNTTVAFPSVFQDEIIKNHDMRILKKDDGSIIIGYVIFNKKYIIISTSREALGVILDKLISLPPR